MLLIALAACPGESQLQRDGASTERARDLALPPDAINPVNEASGDRPRADRRREAAPTPDAPPAACFSLGGWQSSAPFAGAGYVSHPLPSFASGQHYFVHTMKSDGSDRKLYSGKQQPDGSLSPWKVASADHGGGPHGFTAIDVDGQPFHFRNGHIARYPIDASGTMTGDVALLEASVDSSFGGNRYVWDSAVYVAFSSSARRVIHLGGFSFTGYSYRPDIYVSPVPIGSSFQKAALGNPAGKPGKAAIWVASPSEAFLFSGESGSAKLWRARVLPSGSIDPFVALPSLPAGNGNGRGDLFVKGNTLFAIRGSLVYRAVISTGGALSSWKPAPALPSEMVNITWGDGHLEGQASGLIGGHVYVTGPTVVYFAPFVASSDCAP